MSAKWKTCYRKTSYTSRSEARKQARRLTKKGNGKVDAYRCPVCNGLHVGRRNPDGDVGNNYRVIGLGRVPPK